MAQRVVTAGIDVSKAWLNIALWPKRDELRVEQCAAGYAQLVAWLTEHAVMRVGYEIAVIDALETSGFEVMRFNARRIRLFAQAKGRLAKNDRADARTIAQATFVLLEAAPPQRRRELDPLIEHLTYRRQLSAWITDCAHQLEHLRDAALRRKITLRRAALRKELAALDLTLARLVAADDQWHDLEQRLRRVPGVGPVLAQVPVQIGSTSTRAPAVPYHLQARSTAFQTAGVARP